MQIIIRCTFCGTELSNAPELAGSWVACPQCGVRFQMPAVVSFASTETREPQATEHPQEESQQLSRGRITSYRRSRSSPLKILAFWTGFVVFGGYAGIYAGLLIVRWANREAFEVVITSVPELRYIAAMLP